jgi:hypothetical protein
LGRAPRAGDALRLGAIVLVVRRLEGERVGEVGLRLPEEEERPRSLVERMRRLARGLHPFQDH